MWGFLPVCGVNSLRKIELLFAGETVLSEHDNERQFVDFTRSSLALLCTGKIRLHAGLTANLVSFIKIKNGEDMADTEICSGRG